MYLLSARLQKTTPWTLISYHLNWYTHIVWFHLHESSLNYWNRWKLLGISIIMRWDNHYLLKKTKSFNLMFVIFPHYITNLCQWIKFCMHYIVRIFIFANSSTILPQAPNSKNHCNLNLTNPLKLTGIHLEHFLQNIILWPSVK